MSNMFLERTIMHRFSKEKNKLKKHLNFKYFHCPVLYSFVENVRYVESCIGDENILQEDLYIWLRRYWLDFFNHIQKHKIRGKIEEIGCNVILKKFKKVIEKMEENYKKKVWSNYMFSDFKENWLQFEEKDCMELFDEINLPNCKNILPKVPLLKTHNCLHCIKKNRSSNYFNNVFFETVTVASILNDFSEKGIDMFDYHIQNSKTMIDFSS